MAHGWKLSQRIFLVISAAGGSRRGCPLTALLLSQVETELTEPLSVKTFVIKLVPIAYLVDNT